MFICVIFHVSLCDTGLDEQVMHHIMGLPATIAVESISCASLVIKVPWRHFKSEPMSVSMEQVVVQMAELPTPGPPDKSIPGFDKIIQMLFVDPSFLYSSLSWFYCLNVCLCTGALEVELYRLWRRKRSCRRSLRISPYRLLIYA